MLVGFLWSRQCFFFVLRAAVLRAAWWKATVEPSLSAVGWHPLAVLGGPRHLIVLCVVADRLSLSSPNLMILLFLYAFLLWNFSAASCARILTR